MNRIKSVLIKAKNHVKNHKFAYCASAVAIAAVVLQQRNLRDFDSFLVEKGIDPTEFYTPEYYEAPQSELA